MTSLDLDLPAPPFEAIGVPLSEHASPGRQPQPSVPTSDDIRHGRPASPVRPARRPYPNYRDSGVEWLGKIPEHWQVNRLKHVASYRTSSVDKKAQDGELPVRLCNYTDVYYRERVRSSDGDFMQATASPSEIARFSLNVGDVLITKDSEDWRDIAVPALVEDTADDFVCGYHLGIIRTDSLADPAFVFRAMQSMAVNRQLQVSASGVTRYGLPNPAVGNTLIPLPPLDEQRAIAEFLDHETTKIDELVAKKRLLLERLAEYRTALITRTVTCGLPPEAARAAGLDPSPPFKPSGVDWLGEIPQSWEVKRLDHVASYRTSSVDKKAQDGELPVRLCNYTDVYYRERVRSSDGDFMQATASPSEIARFSLNVGDVLITKDSEDWRDIAVPALVEDTADDFVCGYHLGIIRTDSLADPAFVFRAMQSMAVNRQLQVSASGVTRYGLPNPAVGNTLIPLPPLDEQRAIAEFLDQQAERIDALRERIKTAIERLQEYRTALVTAAVTGKIDVRDPVAAMAGSVRA